MNRGPEEIQTVHWFPRWLHFRSFLEKTSLRHPLIHSNSNPRTTVEPDKRSGQPCIRGLRITVWDVLSWLAAGMTEEQILANYPELERDDFRAVYDFASRLGKRVAL